jgi:hypothetical protein
MAAQIQSKVIAPIAKGPVVSLSRDDLAVNDVVELTALGGGTFFQWTLVFVPEGSTAVLTPPANAATAGPVEFTVDKVGPYLVRLVWNAGLADESTQYVRLRAPTASLGLHLVAAGERRDSSGVIPVDVDIEGWANEQNFNLQALETAAITRYYPSHFPMGPIPASVAVYNGWASAASTLVGVSVFMGTVNTQGNFTFGVANVATAGTPLLGGGVFDMNTLAAGVVTTIPLKAAGDPDLSFAAQGRWDVNLDSDDAGFDGGGVYIELIFEAK